MSPDNATQHAESTNPVVRLVGVYNADGTLLGEARYVLSKISGSAHCALCDITHGNSVRKKRRFVECASSFSVELELFHRNDQPDEYRRHTAGQLPCILAVHSDGSARIAIDAAQLDACQSDPQQLGELITQAIKP